MIFIVVGLLVIVGDELYKKYNSIWNSDIKNWIMEKESEPEFIKEVKELFKGESIKINRIPKFVQKIMKSNEIRDKSCLTFKSKSF